MQNVVVTSRVIDELARFPNVFPDEAIFNLGILLEPKTVNPFIPEEDELAILRAESRV